MPNLRIKRASSAEAGILRRIKVKAGGSLVGRLRPDEEISVELPAGRHEISARMDWFTGGPIAVEIQEGHTTTVEVSLSMISGWKGFLRPGEGIGLKVI